MALAFWLGIVQISLSTPDVFLPWFSVTRFTASALPLNEWVSRRWRTLTFPHLPAFVAWTIRIWSRRTLVWAAFQLMESHSSSTRETAPASVPVWAGVFAAICFVPFSVCQIFSSWKTRWKSACFRTGGYCPPYPPYYWVAFAFSILLYPQLYRLSLRSAFPVGRATDLPRSAPVPVDEVGLACPPVALRLRWERKEIPKPVHRPFWSSLSAPLALHGSRRLSAIHLSWPYHLTLVPNRLGASSHGFFLTDWPSLLRVRLHCPRSFPPSDYSERRSW